MSSDQTSVAAASEQITRLSTEIRSAVDHLIARRIRIESNLGLPELQFSSSVLAVGGQNESILIARQKPASDRALLSRPRCTFVAEPSGAHLEFVASRPREARFGAAEAIELDFPEVLVHLRRRDSARIELGTPRIWVRVMADASGFLAFEGYLADVSDSGVALVYSSEIALEPGTLLRGCRAELPRGDAVTFDVEVQYSQRVEIPQAMQPGQARANRSGCRFVGAPNRRIVERLLLAGGPGQC